MIQTEKSFTKNKRTEDGNFFLEAKLYPGSAIEIISN